MGNVCLFFFYPDNFSVLWFVIPELLLLYCPERIYVVAKLCYHRSYRSHVQRWVDLHGLYHFQPES